MIQPDKRCRNCGQHLLMHQKFCHDCGQKSATHRIDFHFLIHEIQHGIFHVDGGILYTLRQLFTRPGHMLRDYLDGKRQQHFKPLLLVVILGSLCSLIQYFLKPAKSKEEVNDNITTKISDTSASKYIDFQGFIDYFREIFNWLGGHFAITVLLMLPAAALGFYLGFRKYRYNYAEWLVILLFLTAQSLTVYAFFIPLNQLAGIGIGWFYFISWVMITASLIEFCYGSRKRYIVLRSFWSMFLSYFIALIYIIMAVCILAFIGLLRYGYTGLLPKLLAAW